MLPDVLPENRVSPAAHVRADAQEPTVPTNPPTSGTPFANANAAAAANPRTGGAYAILKALTESLDRHSFPPPDEKLKRIVGAQIKHLLAGGYAASRIQHHVIELGLSWDNSRGHQRLLSLRQVVLQDDADREYDEHERRKADLGGPPEDPAVRAAIIAALKKAKADLRLPMCGACQRDRAEDGRGLCSPCRAARVVDLRSRTA